MFKVALFSILADNIVDPYMTFDHGKDAWDALEAKFGVSDAGTELYVMEQYYDYKMTDERSVVESSSLPKNSSSLSVPYRTSRKDLLRADGKRLTCFCSWCWYEILVKKYSRNWTKLSPRVLFLHEASEDRRPNWGHEEAGGGRRAQALARGPAPWAPRVALALTLRLLKASVAKPPHREPRYGKPSGDAAANPISGDSGDRLRHPAGEGIHLPEDSTPPWSPPE
ncbi:hypothetical protein QYE76_012212 [Lolium multiflorum]|uniref:Uncharacterized protein n=1 Tax=Lolium multiflorum TaxID=4521 RepID=A0AAD8TWU0_LOLMU|nr:hypothetical protein QYE76_012212 [Lolium multiflorum]